MHVVHGVSMRLRMVCVCVCRCPSCTPLSLLPTVALDYWCTSPTLSRVVCGGSLAGGGLDWTATLGRSLASPANSRIVWTPSLSCCHSCQVCWVPESLGSVCVRACVRAVCVRASGYVYVHVVLWDKCEL